jgi:hypothetical protein
VFINNSFYMRLNRWRLLLVLVLVEFATATVSAATNFLVVTHATVLSAIAADPATSEWVHLGADGKLVYKKTRDGDRIMDFSTAGYMGGGVALPDVPVRRTVQPSEGSDDTAAIQAAIDEVAAMPLDGKFRGTVLLGPGMFNCSNTIIIPASGVVLRGSGSGLEKKTLTTIKMSGRRHVAISTRNSESGRGRSATGTDEADAAHTSIADRYVPSGSTMFSVTDAHGFAVGDVIQIRRPVTAAWVKFMGMDDLTRNEKHQTWIRTGTTIDIERRIAAISGNRITLDVPLSDSFDSRYLNPPGTAVVKIKPPIRLTQIGIENLRIESPPQAVNHTQQLYSALRLNGEDCWARNLVIDETMNSVSVGGRRIRSSASRSIAGRCTKGPPSRLNLRPTATKSCWIVAR